jgi:hypothetical protein
MDQPEVDDARAHESGAVSASGRRARFRGSVAVVVVMAVLLVGLGVVSETLWSRTRGLEREVAMLQRDRSTGATGDRGSTASGDVTQAELTEFKACVNDYMRTIGVWSADVGSKYRYNYCK